MLSFIYAKIELKPGSKIFIYSTIYYKKTTKREGGLNILKLEGKKGWFCL